MRDQEAVHSAALSLAELVLRSSDRTPDATALEAPGFKSTYAHLAREALTVADELREAGIGRADVVGVALPRRQMVVAAIAISYLGASFLPLDPAYPEKRLTSMIEDTQPRCIVTSPFHEQLFRDLVQTILVLKDGVSERPSMIIETGARRSPLCRTQDISYIVFTSGSTGVPRGVAVTFEGLGAFSHALREVADVDSNSRVAAYASSSFDGSLLEMFLAFEAGAALVVPERSGMAGSLLAMFLTEQRISHLFGPPSAFADLDPRFVPSLKVLLPGGEAISTGFVRRWSTAASVVNVYGPSETTIAVGLNKIDPAAVGDRGPTIGCGIEGAQLFVLDANLRPVEVDVSGELYIAGPSLARGYVGDPGRTASRFVACPFAPGQRMYRTGDIVKRLDMDYQFVGRADNQFKRHGFRVEPGEIEDALERHPLVLAARIVLRESLPGGTLVVAYVVTEATRDPETLLRLWLREQVPEFLVPDQIVRLDRLPLTPNGKLDQSALPERRTAPLARSSELTPSQALVYRIWSEVLDRAQIDLDANFFDIGGNSLRLVHVRKNVQDELGVQLSVVTLFEATTIRALAGALDELSTDDGPGV